MYEVEIVNSGQKKFQVKTKNYEFTVDTGGEGVSPPDTFLASLGSCIGVYLRKYAEGAKFDLPGFRIVVSGEFSKTSPVSFRQINIRIDLNDLELDEHRKTALLNFIKNCPVHNTLKIQPEIVFNFV